MSVPARKPHGPGVAFALGAALLFGLSTPFVKLLVGRLEPALLAGLLYLGSGTGLAVWRWLDRLLRRQRAREAPLTRADLPWLAGAIASGGVVGPSPLL